MPQNLAPLPETLPNTIGGQEHLISTDLVVNQARRDSSRVYDLGVGSRKVDKHITNPFAVENTPAIPSKP